MRPFWLLALLLPALASAQTVINLPDPSVTVRLVNNTTTVTYNSVSYYAQSQFIYFSECPKPDGVHYHCNIMTESGVVLLDGHGHYVTADITAAFASTLITSGHNWWRQSQTVITGQLVLP